jgi:capsular exopolysaccharide synthesis family protein
MNKAIFGLQEGFERSGPGVAAIAGEGSESTPLLRYYAGLFWRRRKVVLASVAGFVALGVIVTLLMIPKYTATSQIEIKRESAKIVNMQGVEQDATDADQEFYQTQYGLLRAQSLAEKVADDLKLADNPAFFDMFGADDNATLFTADAARRPRADRARRLRAAGEVLLDHLRILPLRQSRLVEISFTSPDAVLSQKVANEWAEDFIQSNLDRRYDASSYARDFLESRLATLRSKLDQSELALQNYAQAQRIITVQGKDGSEQSTVAYDLVALNNELATATAARVQAQARLAAVNGRAGEAQESLDNSALNELRAKRAELAADYQKMLTQFEPAYPPAQALQRQLRELDRSIAREERRIGGAVLVAYQAASGREKALQAKVDELESSFLDQRRRGIQYRILGREVDTNRQLYDALLQRYKEIGIAGGVGTNNISIVDTADLPLRPSSPRLLLNLILALFGGIAVGAVLAFLLEQSDETMADPSDAERLFGLPLLGSIPNELEDEPRVALRDPKSTIVDAYLAVQTSLQFSTEHGVPQSLAVTSTRPGEGKSTTALALAALLARSGKRVVLIDGDMRSPSVHQLMGIGHDRGLSTYLSSSASAAELLVPIDAFGFSVMTAGPIPPNAAQLLTGNRISELIAELLLDFDHVIIDAPPVMGMADVPLIAGRVDGVVQVVEAHGIRVGQVRAALQRLTGSASRVLGIVVTKFDPKKSSKGYGYAYGYDYGDRELKAS